MNYYRGNAACLLINIKALPQSEPIDVAQVLGQLCTDVAEVYGCSPRQVWAAWAWIEPGHYVEGDRKAMMQPEGTHPPIVNITAFEGQNETTIKAVLKCIHDSLSDGLELDGNLFITYTEALLGRVFTGGSVRKDRYIKFSIWQLIKIIFNIKYFFDDIPLHFSESLLYCI